MGKGACATIRCCPVAKPCARPTSCLGLSFCSTRSQPTTPALRLLLGQPTLEERAMSRGERNIGDARKGGPAGCGGGGGGRPATVAGTWAVSALCLLLSVGSAAACLLLGAQAAALQGRVEALEEERELLRRAGQPGSLAAWAEPHLERLLREVRSAGREGSRRKGGCRAWGSVFALGVQNSVAVSPRTGRASPPGRPARGAETGGAGPEGFLLQPQGCVPE